MWSRVKLEIEELKMVIDLVGTSVGRWEKGFMRQSCEKARR